MIVLIGFMGAGKTTVGRMLAERLGLPFVDSDLTIEQRQRRPIKDLFAAHGEPGFRDIEQETIKALLDGPAAVLSLGGGACGREATRQRLRAHTVIYLQVELAEAMARVGHDEYRPMLRDPALAELFDARQSQYLETATIVTNTTGRRAEDVVLALVEQITTSPVDTYPCHSDDSSLTTS